MLKAWKDIVKSSKRNQRIKVLFEHCVGSNLDITYKTQPVFTFDLYMHNATFLLVLGLKRFRNILNCCKFRKSEKKFPNNTKLF